MGLQVDGDRLYTQPQFSVGIARSVLLLLPIQVRGILFVFVLIESCVQNNQGQKSEGLVLCVQRMFGVVQG